MEETIADLWERELRFVFLKEIIEEREEEWLIWASNQLGYTEKQPKQVLIDRIDFCIRTAKRSHKFGL